MELYIQTRWKDVKQTTRAGYRTQLNFMRDEHFGKKKIKDITESEALLWLMNYTRRKGRTTRHYKHFAEYFVLLSRWRRKTAG